LPELICSVLAARGFEPDAAKTFLRPELTQLHDASLLADGAIAAQRLADAVSGGERILVHGDYDVDGICATALLTRWLRGRGADVVPFVPHRIRDGYDFSAAGLAVARAEGAGLVVTADCGSVAHATVEDARRAGLDVIVTDHHTVSDRPLGVLALVNPRRPDCAYPEEGLSGTGVAFKLAGLVADILGDGHDELTELLDLVALATIADLVPLTGENRVLSSYGLRRFRESTVAGIRALLASAGLDASTLTAGQIGFGLAPRINAAGRIGEAGDALRLLLTDDEGEAARLAVSLEGLNTRRREEDRRTLDAALKLLSADFDPTRDFGVVLAGLGWHPGVIGIVASRVVERIHRPVVLLALDADSARGSARSIPGFDLYGALAACSEHLDRFGGHRQAAGMDLSAAAVPAFRSAFNDHARSRLADEDLRPVLRADAELRLRQVDLPLLHWLGYLGPHGMGNPGPVFVVRDVRFEGARLVGEDHLKGRLVDQDVSLDAIGFGLARRLAPGSVDGVRVDALVRLERNDWKGRARPQAKLVDLRVSDAVG
jgi:single-stranded-DNA-specific exonuclease